MEYVGFLDGTMRMDWCGTGEGTWWVPFPPQWDLIVGLGECSERYRPIGIFTFRALWFGASNMVYSLHVPILRELNVPSCCAKVRVNWDVYMLFGCMLPHSRTVLGMCENLFRWPHS